MKPISRKENVNILYKYTSCAFILSISFTSYATSMVFAGEKDDVSNYHVLNISEAHLRSVKKSYWASPSIGIHRFFACRNNIFRIPVFGALFFKSKKSLLEFEKTENPEPGIIDIPSSHVVRAEEDIRSSSGGGNIFDELYGEGYIIFKQKKSELYTRQGFGKYLNTYGLVTTRFPYHPRHELAKPNPQSEIPLQLRTDF